MDFTIDTGDSADNQQLNETEWVRTLLEGGTLNPNSGVDKTNYSHLLCPNLLVPGAAEAARYTGVQDYNDYFEGTFPEFYDPNSPQGPHAAWPKYPGLMDKAQQSFTAAGLERPLLRRLRQPRRAGPGQRGGQRRLRGRSRPAA